MKYTSLLNHSREPPNKKNKLRKYFRKIDVEFKITGVGGHHDDSRILQVPATKYTFLGFKERLGSGYFVNPLSEIHTLGFSKIIWVPAILRTP